jgi:tRNA (cytidine32/guanosine34-2'-O)-methyltransferase
MQDAGWLSACMLLHAEAFVVCQNYTPPPGFQPSALRGLLDSACMAHPAIQNSASTRLCVPFLACGDLSGWDADMSYDLQEGYVTLAPVQPPTAPAYKSALEMAKREQTLTA